MNVEQLAEQLKRDSLFMRDVVRWETLPQKSAVYGEFPLGLDTRIQPLLKQRGIHRLYSHQAEAIETVLRGEDVVIVTPTASGKTLCYNLPVLSAITARPDTRALYLFPTKALAADQAHELYELIEGMGADIKTYTYDGDTPVAARRAIRQAGHIVVTNPDMLHSGILPHHTKWVKLFENLQYIVIDEIHAYRGVFGSNLANVLRRLIRLCAFYRSKPRFILCSATIANPGELASLLTGRPVTVIEKNGAPSGERHFVFINPQVINRQLGIRVGVLKTAERIASALLQNNIQTITFCKSRVQLEVLTRHLKDITRDVLGNAERVRGYRGGYLPSERRDIERGLRDGSVKAVVSTNALELGVDIGALDACVLCGYPGTIAALWQQSGRAGRRQSASIIFYIASSAALDQYIVSHPDYFFSQSPEHALINPDNLYIMLSHLKCAAFELPFEAGESFGINNSADEMINYLCNNDILRRVENRFYWSAEDFPASEISLRSASAENFVIIDITDAVRPLVIGEMDRYAVPMLLHQNAIYMHEGRQFQVERLDFDACKAYVRHVNVDYYTDADLNVSLSLLDISDETANARGIRRHSGEVKVTALVKMFKKMKLDTGENLGFGHITLPETDMHTTAMWWTLPLDAAQPYTNDALQGGMLGIANLLRITAPLFLMCSPRDIAVVYQVKGSFTELPTIFIYDNYPGGIGLADKAFSLGELLLEQSLSIVSDCACQNGCPSCAGPVGEIGLEGKAMAGVILCQMIER